MKQIFTLLLLPFFFAATAQVDGTLDQAFGNNADGTSTNFPGGNLLLSFTNQKIIVLPNKKILQVFSVSNGLNAPHDFGIAQYTAQGDLDNSFNSTGIVITDLGGDDYATSVAVQTNGNIIVAGYTINTTSGRGSFALVQYNSSGSLDPGFGSSGILIRPIGYDDRAYSVAVEPTSGKITVAGFSAPNVGGATQIALARFDKLGNPDISLNGTGKIVTATNTQNNEAYSLALQLDGKIVVAGNRVATPSLKKEFLILRYTSSGGLDPSFASGAGYVATNINASGDDYANSVALQSDGMILAAGTSNNGVQNRFAIVRYQPNGLLDAGFFDPANSPLPGVVVTAIGSNDIAFQVMQQLDNRLVVAGASSNGKDSDFVLARYNLNGTLDNTFNNPTVNDNPPAYQPKPGIVAINFLINGTSFQDVAYSFAAQGTNLIMGGLSGSSGGVANNLVLARLLNSSSLFDPLPVHLYIFTGTRESGSILLKWQSSFEKNSDYFDVQRSQNGIIFESIGKVVAKENSSTVQNYSFRDQKPFSPNDFYRLRIVDKDKKQSFSKILSIRFELVSKALVVYPNPVSEALNVELPSSVEPLSISIFDASGKLVKLVHLPSVAPNTTISIDMNGQQKGLYFIKVKDSYIKIIKQ
ncbi:MAG: hypothetical protein NVSMB67_22820 [Flavisolibacter sp.]